MRVKDNTMPSINRKKDKQRSTKHYTENKDEQHDPHKKPGVNSCALEGYAFTAPLVALVVLV